MAKNYKIIANPVSHDHVRPWAVRCIEDGWTYPCRTLVAAMHWLHVLNGSDDEPVDLQVQSPRAKAINAAIWATRGGTNG